MARFGKFVKLTSSKVPSADDGLMLTRPDSMPPPRFSDSSLQSQIAERLLPLGFAALMVIGGATAMFVELAPYTSADTPLSARVIELADGNLDYGLSTSSRHVLLADCRAAMVSLIASLQTTPVRRSLNSNCLSFSDRIVAEQPTFSIAWLTGALAAAQLADWDGFNERLSKSTRTGAVEQWIAQIRVAIAEDYHDRLDAENAAGNQTDMRLMTDTDAGLLALARVYLMSPASRGRITAVVDRTDQITHEKFLRRVRMLSSGEVV
ncbi:hypothetical protein [Devosia beringensis]|uniref:hypothetical protein n=1 Tax=Devosia beringensis TaxID=2657486 RepID=UPI00186B6F8B|nr:hypothetical protein [Devosia beringensis]